jgi:TonB family protein
MKPIALTSCSYAASTFAHAALIVAGVMGWRMAGAPMPPEAFEVTLGDLGFSQGVSQPRRAARPVVAPKRVSSVDLAVKEKKAEAPKQTPAADEATAIAQQGDGGEAAASGGKALTEFERYQVALRQRIHEALVYPRQSKNLDETGTVKVKFTILRDGTISDVGLWGASAFDRLNSAALDTVRRVAKVDPLPKSYAGEAFQTVVPIDYVLR